MLVKLMNRLFRPIDRFSDGASVFYGHKECICYRDSSRRFIEFDIEYDGRLFIIIADASYWKGELSGKIERSDIEKIKKRIALYFDKRGIDIELR